MTQETPTQIISELTMREAGDGTASEFESETPSRRRRWFYPEGKRNWRNIALEGLCWAAAGFLLGFMFTCPTWWPLCTK